MREVRKLALVFAMAALLAAFASACGGGESDDSTAGSPAATPTESTAPVAAGADGEGKGEGEGSSAEEGSAPFRTPGGDNSIQNFGEEADAAELDAASAVLAGYLRARARDDWARECTYLAQTAVEPLENLAPRSAATKGKGCAGILAALVGSAPISTRSNTLTGGVASLRVQGDRAFALYHGPGGVDYFVPLVEEDGEWKVAALAPSEFP